MYFYSDQPVAGDNSQISTAPHHLLPTSLFTAHLSLLPLGVVHSHRWRSWVWRLCSWQQWGRSRDIAALQHSRMHIFVAPANSNCKKSTVDSFNLRNAKLIKWGVSQLQQREIMTIQAVQIFFKLILIFTCTALKPQTRQVNPSTARPVILNLLFFFLVFRLTHLIVCGVCVRCSYSPPVHTSHH